MLRRIAGHLFWAARYLERAQWRARLIDVNYALLLEVPPRAAEPWEPLLAITAETEKFSISHSLADEASVVSFFTFDKDNPSSIRNCIESARANLASLRHLISSELWLEINKLYLDAKPWSADTLAIAGMSAFFGELRDRFYAIAGIISSTMPRDTAYYFMQLGAMLERADNVSRLLDVKYHYLLPGLEDVGGQADLRQWAAVLRSASALEAFRKSYGNAMRVDRVVEMLALNPRFPRSVRFCLDRIAGALNQIEMCEMERPPRECAYEGPLAPLLAGTAAQVIGSGLHEFLIGVELECSEISDRIFQQYMSIE